MKAVLFALFAAVALSALHSNTYYKAQFGSYVNSFSKSYSEQEYRYRLTVFMDNMDLIEKENAKGHSYTLGLTQFTDMTRAEFKASRACGCNVKNNLRRDMKMDEYVPKNVSIPESVDWREKGAVNPIKNQGNCGSCWAFAAIGAIEGAYAIKSGELVDLSEQQAVDCSTNCLGCMGCSADYVYIYSMFHSAICSTASYPYKAVEGDCQDATCEKVVKVRDYHGLAKHSGKALLEQLAIQPVSVGVEADNDMFHHYVSGILDSDECGSAINHAILAVGYGVENGKTYIIVRNSWGTTWGEDGYIRMAYRESGDGVCGLNLDNFYPVV